jgi:8-oxo-dGTP diphosphatase
MTRSKVRDEVLGEALFYGELDAVLPFDHSERAQLHAARNLRYEAQPCAAAELQVASSATLMVTFVCMDGHHVLLVDHKASGLWRPTCGGVRPREHPRDSVRRLLRSDLAIAVAPAVHGPIFATLEPAHVSRNPEIHLWYVLALRRDREIRFDVAAVHDVHWFIANELPERRTEPNVRRFLAKLASDATMSSVRTAPIARQPARQHEWCC